MYKTRNNTSIIGITVIPTTIQNDRYKQFNLRSSVVKNQNYSCGYTSIFNLAKTKNNFISKPLFGNVFGITTPMLHFLFDYEIALQY